MKRLASAAGVAVVILAASAPAQADWRIIQWYYGDCKIWGGARPPIWGGWRALSGPIPDYRAARHVLQSFYDRRVCR